MTSQQPEATFQTRRRKTLVYILLLTQLSEEEILTVTPILYILDSKAAIMLHQMSIIGDKYYQWLNAGSRSSCLSSFFPGAFLNSFSENKIVLKKNFIFCKTSCFLLVASAF